MNVLTSKISDLKLNELKFKAKINKTAEPEKLVESKNPSFSEDKFTNKTNISKKEPAIISFDKVEAKEDAKTISVLADKISKSAMEDYKNKVSYKDKKILDYGNLACAYAVSHMLNKLPEFKNVNQMECQKLSQTLLKNGFKPVFDPKDPVKKMPSDLKEGDVVFFPRETEQYGLKKMGHVGIVSKDKDTGELFMINNGYEASKQDGKFIVESKVMAVPLEKYLAEKSVSMILRHKSNL